MTTEYQRRLLELSDERDRWLRACLWWWRMGFAAGRRQGMIEASTTREALDVDMPDQTPMPRVDPIVDRIRYPPYGRKRFGEPRPGDYPGRADR